MSSRIEYLAALLVATTCLALPLATVDAQDARSDDSDKAVIFREDRQSSQLLARVTQLIADEQWAAAGNLLSDVLARDQNALVRPAVNNPAASVIAEATRLIARMPKQGLSAYRLRVASAARQALQQAAATGSIDDLTAVVRRFPYTPESSQATFLLGRRHLDGGRPHLAALYLKSLVGQADSRSEFEPQLSMMLAVSFIQLGEDDTAKRTISDLARRHADEVHMAGSVASMRDADSTLKWLAARLNDTPRTTESDWSGFRGGSRRLATTTGEGPLMRPRWVCRFAEWFEDDGALRHVRQMRAALHDRNVAVLPSAYPLAVGPCVVFRVANDVVCVDASSGKIRWTAGLATAVNRRRATTGSTSKSETDGGDELATRSWGDALAGRLSSDGRSVFAIEGRTLPRRERSTLTFGSMPSPSGAQTHRSNMLVALDLTAEGRRRWVIDGSKPIDGSDEAQTFFLGTPLPLGGRLYVVGEQGQKIRLLVFDAATGAPIWSLHLAELDPLQTLSALRRVYGVTPSYAGGTLVCPTSTDAVAFVDLKSRSLIAGYKLTEPRQQYDASLARGIAGAALIRVLQQQEPHVRGGNYWWDEVALIAGQRVLYTSPSDQKLRCLRLADAQQLWSYPPANPSDEVIRDPSSIAIEHDPLYVGGVVGDRVLVVCRSRVIALRLEDGQPAWRGRTVPLPAGGVAPSGRGLVSGQMFMLPLSNGQIATIDGAQGRMMSVAGSTGDPPPGNLIAHGDRVISLGSERIASYEKLGAAASRVASQLNESRHATGSLMDKAQLLRLRGKVGESVSLLSDVYRETGGADVRLRLTEAMLAAAESDPRRLARYATQLDELVETPADHWRALALRVRAAHTDRDAPRAFAAVMDMHDLLDAEPALGDRSVPISSETAMARRRWLRLTTQRIMTGASAKHTTEIQARIHAMQESAFSDRSLEAMDRVMARFDAPQISDETMWKYCDSLVRRGDHLSAERALETLARSADRSIAGSAILRLAELYRKRGRSVVAASTYRELSSRYGDVVLSSGRTAAQHVAELGADDAVRQQLKGNWMWPSGPPAVATTENEQSLDGNTNTIPMRPSLVIQGPRSPAIDGCTLHFYYSDRAIAAHDRFGRLLWKATVDSGVELSMNYVPSIPLSYAQIRGHLVLVSLGNSLLAIDCLNVDENRQAQLLWHKDLSDAMLPASSTMLLNRRWMRMRLGARWGGGALAFGRLAAVDVAVTKDAVFYTHHRSLHAVDPLTGNVLWKRGNVTSDSILLADQLRVLVIPPDARPALVVRAADGVAEGHCRVPDESNRLATVGTSMLTWTAEDDAIRVALVDPWTKATSWTKRFAAGSVASLVDDRWVAIMQPDGQWKLLRCDDGSVMLERRLDAMPDLNLMHVFRDDHRTYIAASAPLPPDSPLLIQVTMGGRKNPFVNGMVYAIDHKSGELAWSTQVEGHGLLLDQPYDLPVIAFASSVYDRDEARRYSRVMCLDRRSGRIICDERGSSSAFSRIELAGDPENSTVRIRSATRTIEMKWKE